LATFEEILKDHAGQAWRKKWIEMAVAVDRCVQI
jgi:hypothetical protein